MAAPSVWCVSHSRQWWDGVLHSDDGLRWKNNLRSPFAFTLHFVKLEITPDLLGQFELFLGQNDRQHKRVLLSLELRTCDVEIKS